VYHVFGIVLETVEAIFFWKPFV